MGCVASRRINKEERVQICKERKRLMKQLLVLRSQFAAAQMCYLQSLKNTGVTLRQFTDSETLDLADILLPPSSSSSFHLDLPSSSSTLITLPPPPPPLPPFSPDHEEDDGGGGNEVTDEEEGDGVILTPPPLPPSLDWDIMDSSSSQEQVIEEEDWAETNTEFEKEDGEKEKIVTDIVLKPLFMKALGDDDYVMVSSGSSNVAGDTALVIPSSRKEKTLAGIIREIDDYFLKASASGRNVILLLDINRNGDSLYQNFGESMRKPCKSSKVFSALSWSWSSRALHSSKDAIDFNEPGEPFKPGAHGVTLDKIYAEEEKLYKEVKEEENTKVEYGRKTLLLQKYENGDKDLLKTEETRSSIESLQCDMSCIQQSISETHLSILKLIDEELHPQLVILSSGLEYMWRTMYECHHAQNLITQQLNHLINHPSIEPTTDYHRQSTVQLETEVNGWYISFCNLLKSQREYVQVLNRWVQLTDCLADDQQESDCLSSVQTLCEKWQLHTDHLPDKVASEAIKSFLSVIHSIALQEAEEHMLQKKSQRLEKKLQRELNLLNEMEKKFVSTPTDDMVLNLGPNHPLAVKRAKTELFKKRVEDEKIKYLNSVRLSHTMTLSNLQTSLPNVFQALTAFSSVCSQVFETVNSQNKTAVSHGCESEVYCESSQVNSARSRGSELYQIC